MDRNDWVLMSATVRDAESALSKALGMAYASGRLSVSAVEREQAAKLVPVIAECADSVQLLVAAISAAWGVVEDADN
jgi:hypothetical protein